MARPAVWFAAISLPREGQHLVRGRSSVKTSPIAREAFEDIEVRTLPADTRIEVPAIAADLALVDPRIAGRTGMVVGESTEVVWVSMGAPFLGAGQVLHWVLLDGDSALITVSDLSMVRNDRAVLATERVERLPFALGDCEAGPSSTQADPSVREGLQRDPGPQLAAGPTRRCLQQRRVTVAARAGRGRYDRSGAGALVGERWGYEFPEAVLHRVCFDDAAAPGWVSDHRVAGVQDSRAGALRRLKKCCELR